MFERVRSACMAGPGGDDITIVALRHGNLLVLKPQFLIAAVVGDAMSQLLSLEKIGPAPIGWVSCVAALQN
jgi:hypothetical protein